MGATPPGTLHMKTSLQSAPARFPRGPCCWACGAVLRCGEARAGLAGLASDEGWAVRRRWADLACRARCGECVLWITAGHRQGGYFRGRVAEVSGRAELCVCERERVCVCMCC